MILTAQLLQAQEYYLLAGTYTSNKGQGIYVYKFNSKTGDVKDISITPVENPSYMAISPDGKVVYSTCENGDDKGAVCAFSFDHATGKLQLLNKQPSNGDHPCYASVDDKNRWVLVGNYTAGNLCVYRIQKDGSLSEAVQNIQHTGKSINKDRQEKAHVHAVVFSPDNRFVAVPDLGTDKIVIYPFDTDKEKPLGEKATEVITAAGSGPRHIVFHPSRPFAYVVHELSGEVTAYRYKQGEFYELQKISSHPEGYKGDIGSAAIRISNDGKFLYASNRGGSNTIAIYAIEMSLGKLRLKGIQSSGGEGPRDFIMDPTGNYLLSTNTHSNNVTIFKRNKNTGLLKETGKKISLPDAVSLDFMHVR